MSDEPPLSGCWQLVQRARLLGRPVSDLVWRGVTELTCLCHHAAPWFFLNLYRQISERSREPAALLEAPSEQTQQRTLN